MSTNAAHHSEHNDRQYRRCKPLSYHCDDYSETAYLVSNKQTSESHRTERGSAGSNLPIGRDEEFDPTVPDGSEPPPGVANLTNTYLRPAAINPLLTTNSKQFTANRSRDVNAAYIKTPITNFGGVV